MEHLTMPSLRGKLQGGHAKIGLSFVPFLSQVLNYESKKIITPTLGPNVIRYFTAVIYECLY